MLFELTYINHDVERLQEVTDYFFTAIIDANHFSTDLVPEWFRPIIQQSPKLRQKFMTIFERMGNLTRAQRIYFQERLAIENDVSGLCGDLEVQSLSNVADYRFIHNELKDLFSHLYDDTLQKSKLLPRILNTNIGDHFKKWKEVNTFTVCPFCGVENYTSIEGTNRDPYDHWLCKSKYPLAAINFRNLVPIGDKCNQVGVKGEKDILFSENPRLRRLSFYPYQAHSGITISLLCVRPPSPGFKGDWELEIQSVNPIDQPKVDTWVEVFNLKIRYASWVKLSLDSWREEYMRFLERNQIIITSRIEDIKRNILTWKNSLSSIKIFAGVLLLESYIDYLLRDADDSSLLAFSNICLDEDMNN